MALLTIDHFAESLGLSHRCHVILPQDTTGQIGMTGSTGDAERYPTLWLLHGMSDDHTIWLRRTAIERYVAPLGLAVVMPAVHRSVYANMVHGLRYWDYISEELPALLEGWLPLATAREHRYVAGLSMGGWGAFKLGLNQPQRFAAAASLSGALWTLPAIRERLTAGERSAFLQQVYGDGSGLAESPDDLLHQVESHQRAQTALPRLYACCGSEDFLLDANRDFVPALRERGVEITYEEGPGSHEWGFWDAWILRVLQWMGFAIEAPELGASAH